MVAERSYPVLRSVKHPTLQWRPKAARDGLLIDVEDLRTIVNHLSDAVTHLRTDVAGLMAYRDGGVYGESYADDSGPAVRARLFEENARSTISRITELKDLFEEFEDTPGEKSRVES